MTAHFTHEHDQEIASLYRAGHTTYEIAKRFGVSPSPITRALKRQGIQLRPSAPRTSWDGSDEQRAAVVAAYQGGESIRRMAKRLGIRATFLIEALDDAGVTRWHSGSRPMFGEETAAQIVAGYLAGATLTTLAEQHGTNWVTIRNYLVRRGVKMRPPGVSPLWTDERKAEAVRRYEAGESQQQIATSFGCSQVTVSHVLRKLGVLSRGVVPSGSAHASWKGGRIIDARGYALVRVSDANVALAGGPASKSGYVREHRLVMARKFGRPLLRTETVHHIDGDKQNNDPANLQLRQGHHGSGVVIGCLDCGSSNVGARPLT